MSKSSKGGQFEREVSKFLTEWLTGSKKPYVYWRTPASGAMMTIHGDENMSGDIISVRPEGRFLTDNYSIELKNGYPNTSLDFFFKYNKSDPLKSFWEQCVDDAVKSNKQPLLIYKKKGLPTPWVGVGSDDYLNYAKDLEGIRCIRLTWGEADGLPDIWLYEMKEFFERVTPDRVKEVMKCS